MNRLTPTRAWFAWGYQAAWLIIWLIMLIAGITRELCSDAPDWESVFVINMITLFVGPIIAPVGLGSLILMHGEFISRTLPLALILGWALYAFVIRKGYKNPTIRTAVAFIILIMLNIAGCCIHSSPFSFDLD